MERTAETKNKC